MPQSPIQQLIQGVGHRFGWSITFSKDGKSVEIVTAHQAFTFKGDSKEATAEHALNGLEGLIKIEDAKEVQELHQAFRNQSIDIYESNAENWEYFWNHKPAIVGIDTEGNNVRPPLLVQIATHDYAILEVPVGSLSDDLERLLRDDTVVKVFCDNFSHKDKACLGLEIKSNESYLNGSILDVECMATDIYGEVSVARGLGKILDLLEPKQGVRIGKPRNDKGHRKNIGRFTWIEQGKAPRIQSVYDLTNSERRYAVLDAWCTLYAHERLQKCKIPAEA